MRKVWLPIILAIVCLIPASVCAQVDLAVIPSELLQVYREQNIGNTPKDYICFTTPDGVQHAFMITGDGWGLYGYENKGSGWEFVRGGSVLYGGANPRFVPHDTQSTRANGETYPDAYGFDVLAGAGGVCESYHYNGEAFMLCGWVDAQRYDAPDLRNETAPLKDEEYWVVGVVDDRLYIILTEFGATGYVLQDWLFEGNG